METGNNNHIQIIYGKFGDHCLFQLLVHLEICTFEFKQL